MRFPKVHVLYTIICHAPGRGDVPAFPQPIKAGTRISDPGGMQDWVDQVSSVTYMAYLGCVPDRRRSPIPVLTGPGVAQLSRLRAAAVRCHALSRDAGSTGDAHSSNGDQWESDIHQ